jgi:hypothetical protein
LDPDAFRDTSGDPQVKFTELTNTFGQLYESNRDSQSNCWTNLEILGQSV